VSVRSRTPWSGLLLATAGAIAFSGKAIIVKLAYRYGTDAITVIMYRMLFALPLFLALAWWAGRSRPALTARDWSASAVLGFSGYYLASYLDFAGLEYINASLERLITYLTPTLVLIANRLLFGIPIRRRQWTALAVSYLGVFLVFGHDVSLAGKGVLTGSALVFGCVVSYAAYMVLSGQVVKRIGALRLTGTATTIASLLCIGQFLLLRPLAAMHVAPQVIWLSILNAMACTFLPIILIMLAIERIGAGVTAQVGMLGPLSTISLSVMVLGEPFDAWMIAGTMLVLMGIWRVSRPA
jgi:drug/metabolite transporter (DMT)-like permease